MNESIQTAKRQDWM